MSSSLSRAASAMTKTMSSRTQTHHGVPVGETHTRSGVAPSEFSRSLDEGKEKKLDPDEQNYSNRSTASHWPASPAENVITKAESPPPPQPGSGPLLLGRSKSRIQENAGAEGKAVRAPEPPTLEKERKRTTTSDEHEPQETSTTDLYNPRRKAEPTAPSSYTPRDKRYPQSPPASSIERAYSSFNRESDSGSVSLPDASKSRGKVGPPSDSAPSLARTGSTITPPPTSFTTQSQPKHITRASSTNYSTISSAEYRSRSSNMGDDSQIQTAPSMSPSMSFRAPAPVTTRVAHRNGGTPPGPIKPSNSMRPIGQPHTAVVISGSQDGPPNTGTVRDTGGDDFSRLSNGDVSDGGQTRVPRLQLNPTHETGGNNPLAKPDGGKGLAQPPGDSSVVSHHHFN